MSLISTIKTWLFPTPSPSSPPSPTTDSPCRYLLDNSTSSTLTLPDGRKLGYAQYGSPTGAPILYQHGFPGSRLEASQHHAICQDLGLRMIAIDRPGHGWSSPHPGAKLLDWPKDVACLTEHLELENYAVMVSSSNFHPNPRISYGNIYPKGVSGGGPAALSLAHSLPSQKLKCVSLVCAVGPPDIGMRGADIPHQLGWPYGIRYAPYFLGAAFWRSQACGRTDLPESTRLEMLQEEVKNAEDSDRDIYADTDFLKLVVRAQGEAFAQGYDGVWDDGKRSCRPWGFRVQDIRRDLRVQMWYGKKDVFVPLVQGMKIRERLGENAELRVEEESHAGILMHWKREILEGLRNGMEG
jgi:pimeloyl-ACP methyl ester carboxylesterase